MKPVIKQTGGLFIFLFSLSPLFSFSQELHSTSCPSGSSTFELDWSAETYTAGSLSETLTNVDGSGYDITFTVTGSTSDLTTENSVSTPGITNSLSGGVDALHFSSDGFGANDSVLINLSFSPAIAGNIAFDLYNVIDAGTPGVTLISYAQTVDGNYIVPSLVDNGTPSWNLDGPGVADGDAASTAGTNDQVGVEFSSFNQVTDLFIIFKRCSGCGNAANTEFALGNLDFCLVPDTDGDGITDTQDDDADGDGIIDDIEKCISNTTYVFDWSLYSWTGAPTQTTNSFTMPDGTNLNLAAISNGASLSSIDINSDRVSGFGPSEEVWEILADQLNNNQSVDISFGFSSALQDLEFTITDVDAFAGDFTDSIIVVGYYTGFVVFPTLTASGADVLINNNTAVGQNPVTDITGNTANVDVVFNSPVDSITVFYSNGVTAPSAPGDQAIGFFDLSYTGDCGSPDTDGDGTPDYLDIDADNDGIVDYIEWQASTSSPIQPAGTDADNDGIDDNFEILGTPVDTDGDGIPDYKDTDSDDDGEPDLLEGWDTDNDGIADTSPAGTDADNDGLDDNFDDVVGPNSTTNITNNNQTSDDFPNVAEVSTAERDWREAPFDLADRDGDGIDNDLDIDDDNDGILDVDEGCEATIEIDIDLDQYENETTWTLEDPTTATILSGGPYLDADEFINESITVAQSGIYVFTIFDSFGDGIDFTGGSNSNADASYAITIDDLEVFNSGSLPDFGSQDVLNLNVDASCPDTDQDGVIDSYDLDSDGDGIADIIEAGGTDADRNGIVDGTFTDGDGDGWSNEFDSDNGGTALTDGDEDGDGLANRIDIDADDDGIIDIIEAQASGTSIQPSGTDSDGDGIDDNFDPDLTAGMLIPINTDGADNDDYLDTDTDNDGDADLLEGWDTDNDGIANTSPAGTDSDGDGLDDSFDNIVGPNNTTNVTNDGQQSSDFPNLDKATTGLEDWREVPSPDFDGDGIADEIDIDDDNDGVLDRDEAPCDNPTIDFDTTPEAYWTLDNNTNDVSGNGNNERPDGNAPPFSTTAIQGSHSANFNGSTHEIRYSQNGGFMESAYTQISFSAWIQPDNLSGNRIIYEEGGGTNGMALWLDDGVLTLTTRNGGGGSETSVASSITLTVDNLWHHVAGTFDNGVLTVYLDGIPNSTTAAYATIPGHGSDGGIGGEFGGTCIGVSTSNYSGLIDAVRYDESTAWSASRIGFESQRSCDTDGDGVADHNDADSDNDGIPDIVEAGGVDANSDGLVDGAFADTDNDGWSNVFDPDNGGTVHDDPDDDGDGTLNRLDLDEDNDGIANVIEAGGTDNDGDGRQDAPFDSDGDGFANIFDSDNGGSALYAIDTDNDGIVNYLDFDSDGDGIDDNLEGMTTAGFRAENGDFSNDGWDTEYNGNAGGTPIDLSDNDADGIPDYYDLDTDGDGLPDWMEGFDDDNSEDALNDLLIRGDNYELAEGNPLKYVNADDADADGIPDWLEDGDADNIPSFQDPDEIYFFDTDNDGIIDLYDPDNGGVPSNVPDADGDGEYDFRDTDNQISLPVEFLSFNASKKGSKTKVAWSTETELNNDYFLIERAGEDQEFKPIAQVDGAGYSNRRIDYYTYDENPLEGNNYYRLKQVDFNGNFSYSEVELVIFEPESSVFKIYPNPTNGNQLYVSFNQFPSGRYWLQIIDMKGNQLLSKAIMIEKETIWFELEILKGLQLASGNYLLNLTSETRTQQLKFTVTR